MNRYSTYRIYQKDRMSRQFILGSFGRFWSHPSNHLCTCFEVGVSCPRNVDASQNGEHVQIMQDHMDIYGPYASTGRYAINQKQRMRSGLIRLN